MNLEKIIEWGAIILVVILGARWLAGLFGTGDPVSFGGVAPAQNLYGSGMYGSGMYGYPYNTGVVMMSPGIVGPRWGMGGGGRGGDGRWRSR